MRYALYNTLLHGAVPLLRWKLGRDPKHRPLLERFAPPLPSFSSPPVWLHACSVGEVNTALPFIAAFQESHPAIPLLLTASTVTGHALAQERSPVPAAWCPFDTPAAVRGFLARLRPRALLLIETEIWPNLLRETQRAAVPSILLNGRLSDKHFARYQRWMRPCFAYLRAAAMQDALNARRMVALGVDAARVEVCGNLKYDSLQISVSGNAREDLKRELGFPPGAPVLIFGSTRPGDEALAASCWERLRGAHPELRLVLAPRHPRRVREITSLFNEPALLRSGMGQGHAPRGERVVILDTLGELSAFYAIADAAVIGGSFLPGVEGHNPLEPAALGVPAVFGPRMGNFREPARLLLEAEAALQVAGPEDLSRALSRLLGDAALRRQMGTRARKAVLDQRGATARTLAFVARHAGLDAP